MTEQSTDELQPFFYDTAELPGYTIEQMLGDSPERDKYFDAFGRDLVTKTILQSPNLSVYHESIRAGGRVKPHRHGTDQLVYVLRGELNYGSRKVTAGMGYFTPNRFYSWRAGDEGAEWLEIHVGGPAGIYFPERESDAESE